MRSNGRGNTRKPDGCVIHHGRLARSNPVLFFIHTLRMELFFAKLFGLYFLIVGLLIMWRRESVMPAVIRFAHDRALLLIFSVIELAAGLALVIAYPVVSFSLPGVISLIGYALIVEGAFYLAAPTAFIRAMIGYFNKPMWFIIGGILSILAGIFLAGRGFGYL